MVQKSFGFVRVIQKGFESVCYGVDCLILEVNMRDSKFSEDKSKSDSCSKSSSNSSTKSGCHCGSKQAGGEVEEMDIIEMEEK